MPKIFVSKMIDHGKWQKALEALLKEVKQELAGNPCDFLVYFVSEGYKDFDPQTFNRLIHEASGAKQSIGCNASGIISDKIELEMEPGIAALAMSLPEVKALPFYIPSDDSNSFSSGTDLINFLDLYPTENPKFLVFADPGSCDIDKLLSSFNQAYKGVPVIGGLASGGMMGAPNWLALNGKTHFDGAVAAAFFGDIQFETMVAQGCRPVGQPFVITRCEENMLLELAGKPALEVTRDLLQSLPPKDKALSEHSLFVGLAMSENKTGFKQGDFLVRNIMGFDPDSGSLIIGAHLRVGQTMQFQLRDAQTSDEDLRAMLSRTQSDAFHGKAAGGILVTCCGRGKNLYGEPSHDAKLVQQSKGPIPLIGFFANGEIGPVGPKNFIHGYTSSLVLFR